MKFDGYCYPQSWAVMTSRMRLLNISNQDLYIELEIILCEIRFCGGFSESIQQITTLHGSLEGLASILPWNTFESPQKSQKVLDVWIYFNHFPFNSITQSQMGRRWMDQCPCPTNAFLFNYSMMSI